MPLSYLLRLEHTVLPLKVFGAQEIRCVSVLKATGLIEAEIESAFTLAGGYRPAEMAEVICITDDGRAEIAKMRGRSFEAPPRASTNGPVALDYLRKIERSPFPLRVNDAHEIDYVEALKAAGLVDAAIRPVSISTECDGLLELAIIRRITPLGRALLGGRISTTF
jgi:hypothetical protein